MGSEKGCHLGFLDRWAVNDLWLCPGLCVPLLLINPTEVPCARMFIFKGIGLDWKGFALMNSFLVWEAQFFVVALKKRLSFQIVLPVITVSQMTRGSPSQHKGNFLHHLGLKQSLMSVCKYDIYLLRRTEGMQSVSAYPRNKSSVFRWWEKSAVSSQSTALTIQW